MPPTPTPTSTSTTTSPSPTSVPASGSITTPDDWGARWITAAPEAKTPNIRVDPAPFLRRVFRLESEPVSARVRVCGLGYFEFHVNGRKVGDRVLDPVVTHYDRRVLYVEFDLADLLKVGDNTLGIVLGTGWYNCHTPEVWNFEKAPWRDQVKLLFRLDCTFDDGATMSVISDERWKTSTGPITFDGLRNGEFYDARLEQAGWSRPDFDDTDWRQAAPIAPPGGLMERHDVPPCRVMETLEVVADTRPRPGVRVFDLGRNIAGWVRIAAQASAGTTVTLRYGERINSDGTIDTADNGRLIRGGEFQTDRYTFAGADEAERWEPRFTYHGFQYVQAEGDDALLDELHVQGRFVYTDFKAVGDFQCSDDRLNWIYDATRLAYLGNFVGIPTDCPQREKNGWTGDAQLAAEFGLLNFEAGPAYEQWITTLAEAQRPSGQLPGIAPSAGWGYNWGSGPAWDVALFLIPWYIHVYTGRTHAIVRHYSVMEKYLNYCRHMAPEHIADFGLGDWCHSDTKRMTPTALTDTAYYGVMARIMAGFARLTERDDDASGYDRLADEIGTAFHSAFYRGDGVYAGGEPTAMGCALYQEMVPQELRGVVATRLVEAVRARNHTADFGILGSKYIPRALADAGYVDDALQILVQPEEPGYMAWRDQGATTLWEDWPGAHSRNHVMFGDVAAWCTHYLAGLRPCPASPGFSRFVIQPCFVESLTHVRGDHVTPHGEARVEWTQSQGGVEVQATVPENTVARVVLPGREAFEAPPGEHRWSIQEPRP